MSKLKNKSEILVVAADKLHKECLFPAVAHSSYYSCFLLLKHIWLHKMKKTDKELEIEMRSSNMKLHEFLTNKIITYIDGINNKDSRAINNNILQLKKIRVKADYKDEEIYFQDSANAIQLSKNILPILTRYI